MKVIKFTKIRYIMFAFSLIIIIGGLVLAFVKGPNWGIDFLNGLNMTVSVKDYDTSTKKLIPASASEEAFSIKDVREWFSELDNSPEVQLQSEKASRYAIRIVYSQEEGDALGKDPAKVEMERLSKTMEAAGLKVVSASVYENGLVDDYHGRVVVVESSQSSSPDWTKNSWKQLVLLLLVALLLITIYIWVRFTWGFALAAMTALIHDILVMVGFLCIVPFEVSKTTIAALLTIIGYSLNDTIVIFDRIRENRQLMGDSSIKTVINTSITQSLSRTLITSLTTFIAVAALFFLAEGDVKSFSANMMAGVIIGTYSSIFIASPVQMELVLIGERIRSKRKMKKFGTGDKSKKSSVDAKAVSSESTDEVEIPMIERKKRRKKK